MTNNLLKEHLAVKNPLISVIIPLYNHAIYIEECLNSVLEQEGALNIELLLLDDGSTDAGFEVACRWRDVYGHNFCRIEFESQPNAGITYTFDKLIRKSSGEFITILASDDVLMRNSIIQRLALFRDNDVMAVFGDAMPIDKIGNIMGKSAINELGKSSSRVALGDPRTLPWELIFRWNIYGSVLLCRREALIKPDGSTTLNLDIYSEDMQLYYGLASQGLLRYLDICVAKYRVHSFNTSGLKENIPKIREGIYLSRKNSLKTMPILMAGVVRLQAITYLRWSYGYKKYFGMPAVILAYIGILSARVIYDFTRKIFLRQISDI